MKFDLIESAIRDIARGRLVIVVDDEDRENEGDLVMAAERATPRAINFMAKHGRGLICMPLTPERLDELRIPSMVPDNTDHLQTAFTVSIDARRHVTTGISAVDRATTVKTVLDPCTRPEDLVRPGHIFPLRAREGGVLRRAGHTEASVDFARLAGLKPAAVICEIMSDDGTMARAPELFRFARRHRLKIVTIKDLIHYRQKKERLVEEVARSRLPTRFGTFDLLAFRSRVDGKCHLAIVKGQIRKTDPVLVRVHSECFTGDVLGSLRCDCGWQLEASLATIARAGTGVLLYMRQEGRGIGLVNKIRAYALQDGGLDTVEANEKLGFPPDLRDYGIGAQILVSLGVRKMRLLTNNPRKIVGLTGYGLSVTERVPIVAQVNGSNHRYLQAKRDRLGHLLAGSVPGAAPPAAAGPPGTDHEGAVRERRG
jgi:3,4-dihydroxy 2-butanone 4-phosphate synthase/GTP cyclohydrolase II